MPTRRRRPKARMTGARRAQRNAEVISEDKKSEPQQPQKQAEPEKRAEAKHEKPKGKS